jgi:hypothetical protein
MPPKCIGGSHLDSLPIFDNKEDVYLSIKIFKNPYNMLIMFSTIPYLQRFSKFLFPIVFPL